MNTCEACQNLLLEYLYDVLDDADRQTVLGHLEGCPACQAALAKVRQQQNLLAAAAKMEFPAVRFVEPAPAPVVARVPQLSRPWYGHVGRWASAAAVWLLALGMTQWVLSAGIMVVVFTAAGACAWFGSDYAATKEAVARQQEAVAQLAQQEKDAALRRGQLDVERDNKLVAIQNEYNETQLSINVTGPASVQPGAPTLYHITATDFNNAPTKANIFVQLMNGAQKVGDPITATQVQPGDYLVKLPADLPVKPGSRLAVELSAERDNGPKAVLRSDLQLATAPVYLTHLTTDKPMYQLGEVVNFRSLTLNRTTLRPAQEDLRFRFDLTTPTGERKTLLEASNAVLLADSANKLTEALGPDQKPIRGVAAGSYVLDDNAAGGEYTLTLLEERNRFPAQERKFIVNRYQKPQLNKELDFSRKTYGAGEEVAARCKATDTKNAPLRRQPVEATVQIDGKTYNAKGIESTEPLRLTTDDDGVVNVRFKLPATIDRGLASVNVLFTDGANHESIVRPIPLVLKKLNVEFFPEGGDLIAGLENRVYFEVRTPLDKPADLKGRLLEDGKPLAVEMRTLTDDKEPGVNQGMGVFAFTPTAKHKYEVQVDEPAGITQRFALPEVKDDGVVLTIEQSVVAAGKPIEVHVRSRKPKVLVVGAYCRGQLLDVVRLEKGQTEAKLNAATPAGGVCRVTVFEELDAHGNGRHDVKPIAERLIYRDPAEKVSLAVHPDKPSYLPGEKVKLLIDAVSEKDERAPAVLMVSVVDKRVLTLADEKTYRSMPTHLLLTTEVRRSEDLEYADFLLGPQEKARQALDLLLGTQGWRRFAEQDPVQFRQKAQQKDQAEADRLLYVSGQSQPVVTDFVDNQIATAEQTYREDVIHVEETKQHVEEKRKAAAADAGYLAALAKLAKYRAFFDDVSRWTPPGLGALLLGILAISVILGLTRKAARRAVPYFVTAAASAVALLVGLEVYVSNRDQGVVASVQPPAGSKDNKQIVAEVTPLSATNGSATTATGQGLPGDAKDMPQDQMDRRFDKANHAKNELKDRAGEGKADEKANGGFRPPEGPARPLVLPDAKPGEPDRDLFNKADKRGDLGKEQAAEKKAANQLQEIEGLRKAIVNPQAVDGKMKGQPFAPAPVAPATAAPTAAPMPPPLGLNPVPTAAPAVPLPPFGGAGGGAFPGGGRMPVGPGGPAGGGGPGMGGMPGRGRGGKPLHENFDDMNNLLPPLAPVVVREYAHHHATESASSQARTDFAETLYWHPVLVLPNGKGEIEFDLSDSVTTYQATVFAHTLDGRLGAVTQTFDARLPFTLEPKVPIEVTSSDKIDVPLSIATSAAGKEKVNVKLTADGLKLLRGEADADYEVRPGAPLRKVYRFQPIAPEGRASLTFAGKSGTFTDSTRNSFAVVPEGFPVVGSHSDLLEGTAAHTLSLPNGWVKGTLKLQLNVYPSTLADLQKGLDSLLREPNGCFEQTSTSNYPNLLILDYLKESDQTKPEVERHARDLLSRGYQKLVSFECTDPAKNAKQGYEWFGGTAPAHEALTAYGLLQFRDMARVQEVDPQMLERTKQYLLNQRDGKGGFKRNSAAIDTFGRAPDNITNAYIIWALTESGKDDDVTLELNALNDQAKKSSDPYFLSLVANGLLNRDRANDAVALLKKVAEAQKPDGHLDAAQTSITGSGGRDLQIETTGLAVLGWLKANRPTEFNVAVQKSVRWIGQQRGGYGGFGSTQSTILALKALIAYTRANKKTAEPGELKLYVNEREASKLNFPAGVSEALTLTVPDAEEFLKTGANKVRVEISGKNAFPYTLTWTYSTLQPVSAENVPVRLTTKLARTDVQEGDAVRLTVQVENKTGKGQGMAVAIIGMPGGLTVPEDLKQLKEYTRKPVNGDRPLVSAFEIRGRELILYWRDLAPEQKIEVPVDLICRVPGEYSGPASRAYLYYNADVKHWVEPLKVAIAAKE